MPKHLPTPLQAARQAMGLTQQEMADSLGISRNYVSLIEIGQRPLPADLAARIEALSTGQAATKRQSAYLAVRDGAEPYVGQETANALRAELSALRSQVAGLTRVVETQAATIDRLSRGVCRYPVDGEAGPTTHAAGAAPRAG